MTKVYVGMSGGVDSSLSAALLVEQGYDVVGVYMKNWTQDAPGMRCPWADDLADAKRVAVHLNIPFRVIDFQTEYKQLVVNYMISEYQAGRTPNPDIMCNQDVKFGLYLQAALADGADMIATGHYARSNGSKLLRAANEAKDQTYFLYRVTGEAMKHTIFPIGGYKTKDEVRAKATEFGLTTAAKRDSQGICFIGSVSIRDFLSQYVKTEPGAIVDRDNGQVVGQHDGALFYTFGQRHGLNVGGGLPYYVVGKDMAKNEVYVSRNLNSQGFWNDQLVLRDLHWINEAPIDGETYQIRVRHRAPLAEATVELVNNSDKLIIKTANPERAVALGQSVVIYDGDEVLGGGIVQ
ncbi:MAG: tRNA 2-thiouridine(34) synthase MnmA [Candidatus Saccharibacteria bacterium]|nr:tRNA 2-thiouridine(34) synthase MnmA [Candidatus Saccharibacteria bacterium]